jgi:hypothetical protein
VIEFRGGERSKHGCAWHQIPSLEKALGLGTISAGRLAGSHPFSSSHFLRRGEHQHKQKGMDESLLSHPGPKNSDPFWRGGKGGKSFVAFVCVCVCVFASIYSIDLAASISSEKKLSSFYNSFG